MSAKVLTLDIERVPGWTKPLPFWSMKDMKYKYLTPDDVQEWSRTFCHAYQWEGDRTVSFMAEWEDGGRRGFLERTSELLTQADLIVGHNMRDFDLPHLLGELVLEDLPAPAEPKVFDTLRVAQKKMNLENNQLDTLDKRFGFSGKNDKYRIALAMAAVQGDPAARKRIERYAKGDIRATRRVKHRLTRYNPVNLAVFSDGGGYVCPRCESTKVQRRGYATTSAGRYARYQCQTCGGWSKEKRLLKVEDGGLPTGTTELRPA